MAAFTPLSSLPKIRACLFDMDGLLLDSEDLYTIATNRLLARYNRPNLTWSIKAQLQGRPGPEASRIFQEWAQLPYSDEEILVQLTAFQKEIFPSAKPLSGVVDLLQTLRERKVDRALATSSGTVNFKLKTDHLGNLFSIFAPDNTVLGDDPRVPKGRGKPAPDIYLLALKTVNESRRSRGEPADIKPAECLVFEDSVPGVEAGRRAGMQVVWCPHPGLLQEYRGREKQVLAGLMGEYKDELKPMASLDSEEVPGRPGRVDDGWAVLLHSLENFPYERYGLEGS